MGEGEIPKIKPPTLQQAFQELEEWWPDGFEEDIQRVMAFRIVSLRQNPEDAMAIVGRYDLMKIIEKLKKAEETEEEQELTGK